jgi:Tfp pilus assembly PilM family ATPase
MEIDDTHAAFVQFGRARDRGTRHGAEAATVPHGGGERSLWTSPQDLRELVDQARRRAPLRGSAAVLALRGEGLRVRVLSYDVPPGRDEGHVILERVEQQLGANLAESIVDYVPIRSEERLSGQPGHETQNLSSLVAVAERSAVIERLECLAEAGLEAQSLEIVPLAIRRLLQWTSGGDEDDSAIVIECGSRQSHLVAFSGRRLILYRSIEFGRDEIVEELGKSLDVDRDEASQMLAAYGFTAERSSGESDEAHYVASSITTIAEFAVSRLIDQIALAAEYSASRARGRRAASIRLLGDGSLWRGLDQVVTERTDLSTSWLDPEAHLQAAGAKAALRSGTALTLATGYALRGVLRDE